MTTTHYSLVTPEGVLRHRWTATEAEARHFATLVHPHDGDRLIDGTGRTVGTVRYGRATIDSATGTIRIPLTID